MGDKAYFRLQVWKSVPYTDPVGKTAGQKADANTGIRSDDNGMASAVRAEQHLEA